MLNSINSGISNSGAITGGSYGIGLNNSSLTGGIVNNGTISAGAATTDTTITSPVVAVGIWDKSGSVT